MGMIYHEQIELNPPPQGLAVSRGGYVVIYNPLMFMRGSRGIAGLMLVLLLLLTQAAVATVATPDEARQVSRNWLNYSVYQNGAWAGVAAPQVIEGQEVFHHGILVGYYFSIEPSGYIVVPILKELPAIKAYSETDRLDMTEENGMAALLKDVLLDRIQLYETQYGSVDAAQPATGNVLFGRNHGERWDQLLQSEAQFKDDLILGKLTRLTTVGPLMNVSWHQGAPFNNLCPMGDGGRSVVGCVATASSMIMHFWQWPPSGTGSHSYTWDGDQSCDGDVGGGTLSATFSDTYDWDNILNNYGGGFSPAEADAVSELCYEVAVAYNMDFGLCGSGANTYDAVTVFPTYFRFQNTTDRENRDDHTEGEWFDIIKTDLNLGQPIQYRIKSHSIVCDGWRDTGGDDQVHMNYGWADGHTTWYTVDNLHCDWDGCSVDVEYLVRGIRPDNLPPVAQCINVTVEADANCEAEASIDNGSYDPEGYDLTYTQTPPGPYPLGVTNCVLTVTDPQGASSSCSADITVVDVTPPVISCPSDKTFECSDIGDFEFPTATDNCDPDPNILLIDRDSIPGDCEQEYQLVLTYRAEDFSGNTDECTQIITIEDTTPPEITCPDPKTLDIEFVNPNQAQVFFEITATDNCNDDPEIVCDSVSGSIWDIGDHTVSCTVYDGCGNTDTCSFSFHLVYFDIKPTSCPNPLNVRPYAIDSKDDQNTNVIIGSSFKEGPDRRPPLAVIPVAILGTELMDVRTLDPETITINGVAPLRWYYEDVATPAYEIDDYCGCTTNGPDGFLDLTLKFNAAEIIATLDPVSNGDVVQLIITGDYPDGDPFFGGDCVIIRGDLDNSIAKADDLETSIGWANPNPFNPITAIAYSLATQSYVRLEVFNILGQSVRILVNEEKSPGRYEAIWDGTDEMGSPVSSGIYLYRFQVGDYLQTRKMLLIK
jgi:hypothetical protein